LCYYNFSGWDLGIGEGKNKGIPYFYHGDSGKSVWHHPEEALWKKRLETARTKLRAQKAASNNPNPASHNERSDRHDNSRGPGAGHRPQHDNGDNSNSMDGTEIMDFSDTSSHGDDRRAGAGNSRQTSGNAAATGAAAQKKQGTETTAASHATHATHAAHATQSNSRQQAVSAPGFGMQATDFFDEEEDTKPTSKGWGTQAAAASDKPLRGWASDVSAAGNAGSNHKDRAEQSSGQTQNPRDVDSRGRDQGRGPRQPGSQQGSRGT
jgi:hypothetical protein